MDEQAKAEKLRRWRTFLIGTRKEASLECAVGPLSVGHPGGLPIGFRQQTSGATVCSRSVPAWALIASWGAFKNGALASYLPKDFLVPSDEKGLPIVMWLGIAAFVLTMFVAAINIGLIPSPWNSVGN